MELENKKLTIAELAQIIDVSKPTVYSRAKALGVSLDGIYSDDEIKLLRQSRRKVKCKVDDCKVKQEKYLHFTSEKGNNGLEAEQKSEINYLKNQIKIKDKQIAASNKLADQAQKLQANLQRQLDSQKQELLTLKVKDHQGFWARIFEKQK
ncbi:hypothetical protein R55227_BLOPHJLP_01698 [Fructobacillus tropaeoli]|uniref:hypothetical protein n=1 Tax=Fructobacillus tropaeoli TaxID=709323 RepID=UPI002DA03B72|nr:hypothetical protein R55227_BLOPHJLP_01698 [Fructobacillus tropaeoli]